MKTITITIILGLLFCANVFSAVELKDGQIYTDSYGIAHTELWGEVEGNLEFSRDANSLKFNLVIYISEAARDAGLKPIISLPYELIGNEMSVIYNTLVKDLEGALEQWVLDNHPNINQKLQKV